MDLFAPYPSEQKLVFSELNQKQTQHISGVIGAVSFSGRIFSIAVLSIISFLPAKISPSYYLILPTVTFFMCGLVLMRWMSHSRKALRQENHTMTAQNDASWNMTDTSLNYFVLNHLVHQHFKIWGIHHNEKQLHCT